MNQRGFTILEVLVSMFIFAVVASTMAPAFLAQTKANSSMEIKLGAMTAAQARLDALRLQVVTDMPASGTQTQSLTVDGKDYSVVTTYCATSAYCASENNRHIRVTVSFNNVLRHETETVFTQLR